MARRVGKPRLPDRDEYGGDEGSPPAKEVAWEDVERRLRDERYYWLVTTRRHARPHSIPIWAIWADAALWFASSPDTVSARNVARERRALVHLESGSAPVVVEGAVDRPAPDEVPPAVVEAYEAKYGWHLDPSDVGMPYFVLRPEVARAWIAADVKGSAVRWEFG